ncbi:MAG: Flp pilus assembly complex ATPase component TadA [Candidatus Sungbacteria bacterium]|uniref:Flp pilus assembly complex ATPase component TadA n=1 Tax=Candidatus Sungiibacteriota bacterium TaxID=2750080 RepID=A0A932YVX6_9BACT|nr:Flp pilus assembly complex ATPase component TadA [Candidatus Sungbacteria bacterium]
MARTLTDILVLKNLLAAGQAAEIRRRSRAEKRPLDELLAEAGLAERDVAMAKSELLAIPVRFLSGVKVPFEILKNIPEESAKFYQFVPIGEADGMLEVGMVNPDDVNAQEALKFIASRLNIPFKVYLIMPSDLKVILGEYKGLGGEVTKALSEFEEELEAEAPKVAAGRSDREVEKIVEEAPITKMVEVILRHAVEGRASDIHIEPGETKLRVRFRVDGMLYTSLLLPSDVHSAILSRIKIMSNLKIDETRIPQDGRFRARVLAKSIDVRVSTFPTSYGEKVALRILDPEAGIKTLSDLGFAGRNLGVLNEVIKKPYGMIVISGPTGSGKTTTLYAIMNILNEESRNVVSLEDPVEYYIAGVNQSQVRPEIGYDFASGLRQILRQDPDIIMVGEIRDKETAQLAVHAALTGHLVLTTLHTNNAIGIIPRLIDMGVDPFLIPSTLVLAVAQRLARRLCEDSRTPVKPDSRTREILEEELAAIPPAVRTELGAPRVGDIYEGAVSAACPKGTRGRIGLFEVFEMTRELEGIILAGPSESKIEAEAKRQGMLTMKQDGVLKVLQGVIGMRELLEVL